jgi:hypothetical protein
MIERHGFESPSFGRRTLSWRKGGNRIGLSWVGAPFGGIIGNRNGSLCLRASGGQN